MLARARDAAEKFGDDETAIAAAVSAAVTDGEVHRRKSRSLHDIDVSVAELKGEIRGKRAAGGVAEA